MKNAIWDFDGTLYDTYPVMLAAFVTALKQLGVAKPDGAAIYQEMKIASVGQSLQTAAKHYDIQVEELSAGYHTLEQLHQETPQPYAGAGEVLAAVVANGGQNFLLTHRDNRAIDFLEQDGLKKYFTSYVTANNGLKHKPDPESVLYLLKTFKLQPSETIMIGDRSLDVEAGHNAGISGGYFDIDRLHDSANAEFAVRKLTDFIPIFK